MFCNGVKMPKSSVLNLSSVVLAYIGDAFYTLYVRTKLVSQSDCKANKLHDECVKSVNANAQAEYVNKILPLLNGEETAVFMRARNTKKINGTKCADNAAYSASTGFEAVLGYLYLLGETERLERLLNV